MEQQQPRPIYNGAYLKAKKSAYEFSKAETIYKKRIEAKEQAIEEMEDKPKPYKIFIAVLFVVIAIVLGCFEVYTVRQSITGIGGFDELTTFLIGIGLACLGIFSGFQLHTHFTRDEFSGKVKLKGYWYFSVLLILIYVGGQYYLASRAGVGIEGSFLENVTTMKMLVLGVAVCEVFIGFAYLSTALRFFSLLITNIRLWFVMRRMDNTSRQTEEYWQRAIFENPLLSTADETPAIKHARDFYNSAEFTNT